MSCERLRLHLKYRLAFSNTSHGVLKETNSVGHAALASPFTKVQSNTESGPLIRSPANRFPPTARRYLPPAAHWRGVPREFFFGTS